MAVLTGYLPNEQGIACYAALRKHTDTPVANGDGRTRDQITDDTMVKRPTGQTAAADVNVELQIMMSLEALLDPKSPKPATIPGYGSLPADIARDIVITSQGRKWWRRLFTAPSGVRGRSGPIVGADQRRRGFEGWLAHLIQLRDQETCRSPFCSAPIGILITSLVTAKAEPPATATAAASANAATTPAKCRAGRSSSSTPGS